MTKGKFSGALVQHHALGLYPGLGTTGTGREPGS